VTFALLIGNLARFWKSVTYNLNLTWTAAVVLHPGACKWCQRDEPSEPN
jgi:hypothetical protein